MVPEVVLDGGNMSQFAFRTRKTKDLTVPSQGVYCPLPRFLI
jgi:hypothetical protein